jgi:hypothetical protein
VRFQNYLSFEGVQYVFFVFKRPMAGTSDGDLYSLRFCVCAGRRKDKATKAIRQEERKQQ